MDNLHLPCREDENGGEEDTSQKRKETHFAGPSTFTVCGACFLLALRRTVKGENGGKKLKLGYGDVVEFVGNLLGVINSNGVGVFH